MNVSKTTRFAVLERDKYQCVYCGRGPQHGVLEIDHVLPLSAGGPNEIANLVTSCFDCNRGKRDRVVSLPGNREHVQAQKPTQRAKPSICIPLCDLCGEKSTTVHWVPWVVTDDRSQQALFACKVHDPGGYWMAVADAQTDEMRRHIGEKIGGDVSLVRMDERIRGKSVSRECVCNWYRAGTDVLLNRWVNLLAVRG